MYRISGVGVKLHTTSSYYLAQKVAENLNERYDVNACVEELFVEDNDHVPVGTLDYFYDTNKVIPTLHKSHFSFIIPGLRLSCNISDWPELKLAVEKRLRNQGRHNDRYDQEFYKLHGANTILCITCQQRDLILKVYDANKDQYDKLYETWHESIIKNRGKNHAI